VEKRPYVIAGIPAYNEEKTIAKVVLLTKKYVDKMIVVDDGSDDMTAEIAKALGAEVVRHEENMGKGAAIRTILRRAREEKPDVLVLLDADGQHNPNDIPKLINPIIKGEADIVIGSRFLAKSKIPAYRKFGLTILSSLIRKASKLGVTDPLSGFRALSRKAYEDLELTESGYGIEAEMLIKAAERNFKIMEVSTEIFYDTGAKTSKKSPLAQSAEIVGSILRKTIWKHPLVYLGLPGILSLIMGVSLIVYLIMVFNETRYFSIPISFMAMIFLLVGIIFAINAIIVVLINDLRKELLNR